MTIITTKPWRMANGINNWYKYAGIKIKLVEC